MHLEIEVHCCNEAGKFFANKHFLTGCKYEICVLFGTLRRTQVRLSRVGSRNIHIIIFQHAICRWLQHPLLANALRADARKAALLAGQGACRQGALGHHSEVTDKMSVNLATCSFGYSQSTGFHLETTFPSQTWETDTQGQKTWN